MRVREPEGASCSPDPFSLENLQTLWVRMKNGEPSTWRPLDSEIDEGIDVPSTSERVRGGVRWVGTRHLAAWWPGLWLWVETNRTETTQGAKEPRDIVTWVFQVLTHTHKDDQSLNQRCQRQKPAPSVIGPSFLFPPFPQQTNYMSPLKSSSSHHSQTILSEDAPLFPSFLVPRLRRRRSFTHGPVAIVPDSILFHPSQLWKARQHSTCRSFHVRNLFAGSAYASHVMSGVWHRDRTHTSFGEENACCMLSVTGNLNTGLRDETYCGHQSSFTIPSIKCGTHRTALRASFFASRVHLSRSASRGIASLLRC